MLKNRFKGVLPLITGSTGLIGSALIKKLDDEKIDSIAVDIISNDFKSRYIKSYKYKFLEDDFLEKIEKIILTLNHINTLSVLHLAAIDAKIKSDFFKTSIENGNDTNEFLKEMIDTNLLETTLFSNRLIKICDRNNIKLNLIFTPSLYAYIAPDPLLYNSFDINKTKIQKSLSYVISKSAIPSLSRYFASTYACKGHRFNCLVPHGIIINPDEDFINSFITKSPSRRLPNLEEIVNPSIFLMSNDTTYMNGQSLIIDGGWSIN